MRAGAISEPRATRRIDRLRLQSEGYGTVPRRHVESSDSSTRDSDSSDAYLRRRGHASPRLGWCNLIDCPGQRCSWIFGEVAGQVSRASAQRHAVQGMQFI